MSASRTKPTLPDNLDTMSLVESRNIMTTMPLDPEIENEVLGTIRRWKAAPDVATTLQDIRCILEHVRSRTRGLQRISGMNTIVRTLGRRGILADYLDIMRHAARQDGSLEQEIALISQRGKMHSIYGWCGQTTLVLSAPEAISATTPPNRPEVVNKLGYPQPIWWISIHIWQPNANATGFDAGKPQEPDVIIEPPHSHPFDFVSMMSVGEMRQSIYRPGTASKLPQGVGRYDGITLQHVDGVWPPHERREATHLETVEHRTQLKEGDSYFMPYHVIHEVEVDARYARHKPSITLFLASESLEVANVYMAKSMADYHEQHPDILKYAQPLSLDAWDAKLAAVAAYLRGDAQTLELSEIVISGSEYAFFHI